MEQEFTVELIGGSPWGFALQGGVDHRSPLKVGRVSHLSISPQTSISCCHLLAIKILFHNDLFFDCIIMIFFFAGDGWRAG